MGGGSDVFECVFMKGHAKIRSRPRVFLQKHSQKPQPTPLIKNVPSLNRNSPEEGRTAESS